MSEHHADTGNPMPSSTTEIDSIMQDLFESDVSRDDSRRKSFLGLAAGAVGVGVVYGAYKAGVDPGDVNAIFDAKLIPTPPVSEKIVDGMVAVNNGLRTVAPPVFVGGLGYRAYQKIKSRTNDEDAVLERMAKADYSGLDDDNGKKGQHRINRRSWRAAGVGIAALTALFAGGSSGVEDEVSNGPLRPVEKIFDLYAVGDGERQIILQSPDATFMSDSYIDQEKMDTIVVDAAKAGITIVPFSKSLPDIDGRSGLVVTMPDKIFSASVGEHDFGNDCENVKVISDEATSVAVGANMMINNVEVTVDKKIANTAQMNRDVAIMSQSDFDNCIVGSQDPKYFGAIVSGDGSQANLTEMLGGSDGQEVELSVGTQNKFEDNNRKFWQKNGTPILLELIAYGAAIGAYAIAGERRSALQRHTREIGTLVASGVQMTKIRSIELRRAFSQTIIGTAIAAPFMPVMAGLFNAAEQGLKVGVGLREVAAGFTVALVAKLTGTARAIKKFRKSLDTAEAVKG